MEDLHFKKQKKKQKTKVVLDRQILLFATFTCPRMIKFGIVIVLQDITREQTIWLFKC